MSGTGDGQDAYAIMKGNPGSAALDRWQVYTPSAALENYQSSVDFPSTYRPLKSNQLTLNGIDVGQIAVWGLAALGGYFLLFRTRYGRQIIH